MEERGLAGLEARTPEGEPLGRIAEAVRDEESGAVTRVIVERDGERYEVPVADIAVDSEAELATLSPREGPEGYAPSRGGEEERPHAGQFVTEPVSEAEAEPPEELAREDWEDEASTSVDSGYPRTDAYIDPDTGEEEVEPRMQESEDLRAEVEELLADTDLEVGAIRDGVVELTGSVETQEDLEAIVEELMGIPEVLEVDTTDVEVG
ncbi:hypothetical protein Rxyl_0298 [Rubrobacter xylanophilus DSM 9941]|uniref:BON domain-containing protein n=1 Tax=Rubrobacter xylanophilus (strain DSM 9941 / JCM 11954 / NBRC 16129 / PRD-1) TaxID=266117 RepID=Q1AZA4_RUBXD|nr:hypothetical protein [Rubrobacter xylanophilus]ABG03274.1 hypothetical protein Rxyl_0298 [Rubrobacter xylanophilus DSM 9941]